MDAFHICVELRLAWVQTLTLLQHLLRYLFLPVVGNQKLVALRLVGLLRMLVWVFRASVVVKARLGFPSSLAFQFLPELGLLLVYHGEGKAQEVLCVGVEIVRVLLN